MKEPTNVRMFLALAWMMAISLGCGALQDRPETPLVPISSFGQVAGTWKGVSKRLPDMRNDAWIILIISEKGFFNFASNRGMELLLGTGTLTILDGRVHAKTDTGIGTFTLHDQVGNLVLVVEASLNDGHHYYLEMTR
ncbi:MAG: hypothetical protein NPIRA04_33880 [Nitrospirales bacterium]|nr:MAG: hypothetical protein NPIRA04_33880 [Nitrospirales bacterium]